MLIQEQDALDALCRELEGATRVGIDTEFVRERTYRPRLCLMQLAFDRRHVLVDTLAGLALEPLLEALGRRSLTKVLHAARQDLEIFYYLGGDIPAPVFDTQIAAAALGLGEQLSYAALVESQLGLAVGKSHARTDWARRPLRPAQRDYALEDVAHLAALHDALAQKLEETGRDTWLTDEFAALSDAGVYAPDPAGAFRRVRGHGRLDPIRLGRLETLAAWRERIAMDKDLPRRWVLADAPLLELTRYDGTDRAALATVGKLPARFLKRHGDEVADVLRRAEPSRGARGASRLSGPDNRLLGQLADVVRARAESLGTSPALLATRGDLTALLRGRHADNPVLNGWRRDVIGEALLAVPGVAERGEAQAS